MLLGFSARSCLLTQDDELGRETVAYIKRCHEQFQVCKDRAADIPDLDVILGRHVFQHVAEYQIYKVLEEGGFALTGPIPEFMINANLRVVASQIDEDAFNAQKNMPRWKIGKDAWRRHSILCLSRT